MHMYMYIVDVDVDIHSRCNDLLPQISASFLWLSDWGYATSQLCTHWSQYCRRSLNPAGEGGIRGGPEHRGK